MLFTSFSYHTFPVWNVLSYLTCGLKKKHKASATDLPRTKGLRHSCRITPHFFFFFLKKRVRATFRGSDRLEQNIVQWHEFIVPFNCFARDSLMFCEIKRLSLIISLVTSVLSPLIAVTRWARHLILGHLREFHSLCCWFRTELHMVVCLSTDCEKFWEDWEVLTFHHSSRVLT